MRSGSQTMIVLDSEFLAWRTRRMVELLLENNSVQAETTRILPFTFNDIPALLTEGEPDVVLRPFEGVIC